MELDKLKNRAAEAFAKGKFNRAAELYEEYCQKDARDMQARIRMGDAWARSGKREKAIVAYQSAAEGFARNGFFPRAIAASKLVLELDPTHKGVQQVLADLYALKKGGTVSESISAAAPPSSRRASRGAVASPGRAAIASPGEAGPSFSSGGKGALELPSVDSEELPLMRNAVSSETEPGARPEAEKPPRPSASVPVPLQDSQEWTANAGGILSPPAESARPAAAAAPIAADGATPAAGQNFGASPPEGFDEKPPPRPEEPAVKASGEVDLDFDPSSSAGAFTELELDGDSLLHAVERAARLGVDARIRAPDAPRPQAVAVSTPPERADKLPEVPLFSDLPPEAFIELFERGLLLRFKKGQRVFEQGSVGQSFFIVCQGSVRVVRQEDDRVRQLAVLPEGSFFGEMALLSDSPRTASVEAASDETELLEISAALLSELSKRHPPVAAALSKFCRQRLLLNVMHTSAIFRPFDGKDRRALIERFRAREVTPSTAIIREGEQSDGLYVILSGAVEVVRGGRVLAHLREGEIFGEMSLLDKAPAGATVRASRRTSLLRLPRRDFDELIMSHPQILALVSALTDDRRRHTDAILSGTADVGEDGLLLV